LAVHKQSPASSPAAGRIVNHRHYVRQQRRFRMWWRRSSSALRIRRSIGLDSARIHDLRHFTATRLLSEGVPVRTVSGRWATQRRDNTWCIRTSCRGVRPRSRCRERFDFGAERWGAPLANNGKNRPRVVTSADRSEFTSNSSWHVPSRRIEHTLSLTSVHKHERNAQHSVGPIGRRPR
jgi:hypothetical protein